MEADWIDTSVKNLINHYLYFYESLTGLDELQESLIKLKKQLTSSITPNRVPINNKMKL